MVSTGDVSMTVEGLWKLHYKDPKRVNVLVRITRGFSVSSDTGLYGHVYFEGVDSDKPGLDASVYTEYDALISVLPTRGFDLVVSGGRHRVKELDGRITGRVLVGVRFK